MRRIFNIPAILLAAVVLCLCISSEARSADWVTVSENSEEICYADKETASRQKTSEREARELTVMKRHKEISRYLEHVEYDCRERKRRVIQTLTYNISGDVSLITKPNAAWGAVAADSKSRVFFESACGHQ